MFHKKKKLVPKLVNNAVGLITEIPVGKNKNTVDFQKLVACPQIPFLACILLCTG